MRLFCVNPYQLNKGFTLVELMVATLLGAFLLSGLVQIFSSAKQTYKVQENLARLQENGRFAIDTMTQDIRLADYWGCSPTPPSINALAIQPTDTNYFFYNFNTALEGFNAMKNNAWAPVLNKNFVSDTVSDQSDVLTLRRANALGFLIEAHAAPAEALHLKTNDSTTLQNSLKQAGIGVDAVVMATNCLTAEAFQVTDMSGSPVAIAHTGVTANATKFTAGNNASGITTPYPTGQLYALSTASYYIATTNNESSLYRRTTGSYSIISDNKAAINVTEALVGNVEQMQILYGVDTNNDFTPNYYVDASEVGTWDKVLSVRVSLLLTTTDDNITEHPVDYYFPPWNPTKHTPTDRKIRRVFTTTIALRNRINR